MKNSIALVKPKLSIAEKKIIGMVIDTLPAENSWRAYRRHLEESLIWHASEDSLELNKAPINKCVKAMPSKQLSSATLNQKLSAIR